MSAVQWVNAGEHQTLQFCCPVSLSPGITHWREITVAKMEVVNRKLIADHPFPGRKIRQVYKQP